MTGPLLSVLHLVPQGVLAGLFFIMGFQALESNGVTAKLLFLLRDAALTPRDHPLNGGGRNGRRDGKKIRRSAVWAFVLVELAAFGATFAITQTVAAVGFPVFIFLLIPLRAAVLPKWLRPEELSVLDEPTASPFTMESVGGTISVGNGGAEEEQVLEDVPGPEGSESESERRGTKGKDVAKDGDGVGRASNRGDVELAEVGEQGLVRRRLSMVQRDGEA